MSEIIEPLIARCGLKCSECEYREPCNCPGCHAAQGKLFWGECELAQCSSGKNHDHCGQCSEFPCANLTKFAFDPEHGDQGKRIDNLRNYCYNP